MPYIGNQPSESFTSFATQEFSTSATTSYTLDHAVTNENEIALFINNVRQQPGSGKAYTATYELGEKVYTSGIAGIFPQGIFVGEITSIDDPSESEFLKIEVSFVQSPFNQDFYLIYKNE